MYVSFSSAICLYKVMMLCASWVCSFSFLHGISLCKVNHYLFIHSTAGSHLDYFQYFFFLWTLLPRTFSYTSACVYTFLLHTCPGMELLDHRLCISLTFLDNTNCFSIFSCDLQYSGTNVHSDQRVFSGSWENSIQKFIWQTVKNR